MPDTKKGPWTLQQVRDQILKSCWAYSAVDPGSGASGSLWVRGYNEQGQLAQSDRVDRSLPVQIPGTWGNNIKQYGHGRGVTGAINSTCNLYMWGENGEGNLGLGDVIPRSSPVQIPGNSWCEISIAEFASFLGIGGAGTHAIKTDNTLWGWGCNTYGVIGVDCSSGGVAGYSSPVQIPGTSWTCIRKSQHAMALRSDCSLWVWGRNYNGQLGINSRGYTNHRSSPVQIPGSWCKIAAAWPISLAIKTDGSLWGWGGNHYNGILGLNDTIQRSSPVQIPGLWSDVFSNSTGYTTRSGGIKSSDGCMYVWGTNNYGQLGLGNSTSISSPTVLPGSWLCLSGGGNTVIGKRTDNTIWAWGNNNRGQYNVDKVSYSSPIQVPGSWVSANGDGQTLMYVC